MCLMTQFLMSTFASSLARATKSLRFAFHEYRVAPMSHLMRSCLTFLGLDLD